MTDHPAQPKHTPEPWHVKHDTNVMTYRTINGTPIECSAFNQNDSRDPTCERQNQANASRAVACVNALAGLNPEAVKDVVEACKTFLAWLDREDSSPEYPTGVDRSSPQGDAIWREWFDTNVAICRLAQEQARAALARIKGGQK